jgi:hypothetical protein
MATTAVECRKSKYTAISVAFLTSCVTSLDMFEKIDARSLFARSWTSDVDATTWQPANVEVHVLEGDGRVSGRRWTC